MPARIYEEIAASIISDIVLQLHLISNGGGSASIFAKSVSSSGSTTIKSNDPEISRHDPDGSFIHEKAYSPGAILKVSYSQKRKDLLRLAEDYIYGSDGNIRVVIGIDINYKDKSAVLLMWQSQIQTNEAGEEELVAHQVLSQVCSHPLFYLVRTYILKKFRKENGEANPEAELRFHLKDFAHPSFSKHNQFGKDISISSEVLCSYLRKAEQAQVINKQMLTYIPLKPGLKKRKRRSNTPPEELNTDDESHYQKQEERVTEKRSQEDSDPRQDQLGRSRVELGIEYISSDLGAPPLLQQRLIFPT